MFDISVILRCRNEERYVGYAIQSVLNHFENPEIIVVNNDSTDRSMNIVNLFKQDSKLERLKTHYADIKTVNVKANNYSPGLALNLGVNMASSDDILILSSHCEIINLNYEKVKKQLQSSCCVWGNQVPILYGKKIVSRYIWANFKDEDIVNYYSDSENRFFTHNAFCFYKRDILIEHPFDEELSGKEDRYWANDMIANNGNTTYYDSEQICHHHFTTNGATWIGVG